jgi:hypothetical protein
LFHWPCSAAKNGGVPRISFDDVIAQLDHVDDPDVLEHAKSSTALRIALEMTRPSNWWGTGVDPEVLFAIAREDGIPVAWIPRQEVITELAAAADNFQRREVLRDRQPEIIDDCLQALTECHDPGLANLVALARAAVAAHQDGHHEAAMALAVSVGEPCCRGLNSPRSVVRLRD